MLATLLPTVFMTALGIVLLAMGSRSLTIVVGVLVVAFCTSSVTGYILGSIFVSRGASVARVQHDYISSVSHELRTPLTSMRLFVETLRDDAPLEEEEKRKCLDLLHREMRRLEGLVTGLIELSRMETGRKEFARESVSVHSIIADALSAFDAATIANPVKIDVHCDSELYVTGDRAALSQALTNLLTNAWKYTPAAEKKIEIHCRSAGDKHVELLVTDNGFGIPRQEQRKIFNEFERGSQAVQHRAAGSGLGLAIVRAIVRAHGGKVDVRSKLDSGSEFHIRLRKAKAYSS